MPITLTPKNNTTSGGGGIKLTPNVKNAPSLEQVKKFESDFKTKSKSKDELPLLTKSSGKFSKDLVTSGKDVAVGGLKSLVKGTIDVASGLQKFGQKFLTGITPGSAKNPEIAKNIQENTGFPSLKEETPQGKTVQNILQPKSQAEKVGGIIETGAELATPLAGGNLEKGVVKGKELVKNTSDFFKSNASQKELAKIKEAIMPKPTVKQAKIAQDSGRLVKGKQPTLFRSGTPDEIIPTKQQQRAVETIQKNIPKFSEMNEAEQTTVLKNKVKETSEKLKPEMQKVPIKEETAKKVNDSWKALKDKQLKRVPADQEVNLKKRQKQFDERLSNINKNSNQDLIQKARKGEITQEEFAKQVTERANKTSTMDDLWEARVEYDNSIPERVKQANPATSDARLLDEKEEWLENREILNDAINDVELGLGKTSKQAFSDMSDYYTAKEGILSKAKIETKPKSSKVRQFFDSKTGRTVVGGAATVLGLKEVYNQGKKLLGE